MADDWLEEVIHGGAAGGGATWGGDGGNDGPNGGCVLLLIGMVLELTGAGLVVGGLVQWLA